MSWGLTTVVFALNEHTYILVSVPSHWALILTKGLMEKRTDDTFTTKGFNAWNKPVERMNGGTPEQPQLSVCIHEAPTCKKSWLQTMALLPNCHQIFRLLQLYLELCAESVSTQLCLFEQKGWSATGEIPVNKYNNRLSTKIRMKWAPFPSHPSRGVGRRFEMKLRLVRQQGKVKGFKRDAGQRESASHLPTARGQSHGENDPSSQAGMNRTRWFLCIWLLLFAQNPILHTAAVLQWWRTSPLDLANQIERNNFSLMSNSILKEAGTRRASFDGDLELTRLRLRQGDPP